MKKRLPIESVANSKRITGFTDAVFAVAITLLVLQIPIPIKAADRELSDQLTSNVPMYISYVISFWVIALFWLKHLQFNNHIKHYSMGLISLNFLYMMSVTFLPFPTAVFGTHSDDQTAAVLYASSIVVIGLISSLMWLLVLRNPVLLAEEVDQEMIRHAARVSLISPAAFAFSIIVILVYLPAVIYVWMLIGFSSPLLRRL